MGNKFLGICKLCNKEKQLEKYKGMWICIDCLTEIEAKHKSNLELANNAFNVKSEPSKKIQTSNSDKANTTKEKNQKKVFAITQQSENHKKHNTSIQKSWFQRMVNFLVDVYYILFPAVIIGACVCFYYDWVDWFTILATVFMYLIIPSITKVVGVLIIYLFTTSEGHRFILYIFWILSPIIFIIGAIAGWHYHLISWYWSIIAIYLYVLFFGSICKKINTKYFEEFASNELNDDEREGDYTPSNEEVSDYELAQAYDKITSEMSQVQYKMDELPFSGSGSYCGSKNYYSLDEDEKKHIEYMRSEYEKLYKHYQKLEKDLQQVQEILNNRRFHIEDGNQEKTRETVERSIQDIETSKYNRR